MLPCPRISAIIRIKTNQKHAMKSEASALLAPRDENAMTKAHSTSTNHLDSSSTTRRIIIDHDKKKQSVLPLLVWVHISFVAYVIGRSHIDNIIKRSDMIVLLSAPALLLLYSLWFMHVGRTKQLFVSPRISSSFPMVVVPLVPVAILVSVFVLRWSAAMAMMEHVNVSSMIAIQATRSLAVGTLIKWHRGVFPTGFAWGTGLPDMLFGLSALALLVSGRQDDIVTPQTCYCGGMCLAFF